MYTRTIVKVKKKLLHNKLLHYSAQVYVYFSDASTKETPIRKSTDKKEA